jgi:hypothetical protein
MWSCAGSCEPFSPSLGKTTCRYEPQQHRVTSQFEEVRTTNIHKGRGTSSHHRLSCPEIAFRPNRSLIPITIIHVAYDLTISTSSRYGKPSFSARVDRHENIRAATSASTLAKTMLIALSILMHKHIRRCLIHHDQPSYIRDGSISGCHTTRKI